MRPRIERSPLDDFASRHATLALAFAWGLAEATFFFIVPDVLLTLIACRALRPAVKATIAALAGALVGGALMFAFGASATATARGFLDHVPGISPWLITQVASQIDERELLAVLFGPIKGIPYKIYAVEWGARRGNVAAFLLISIPARYLRFILSALVARGIARLAEPVTQHRAAVEVSILAAIWIVFYGFYFSRFGF